MHGAPGPRLSAATSTARGSGPRRPRPAQPSRRAAAPRWGRAPGSCAPRRSPPASTLDVDRGTREGRRRNVRGEHSRDALSRAARDRGRSGAVKGCVAWQLRRQQPAAEGCCLGRQPPPGLSLRCGSQRTTLIVAFTCKPAANSRSSVTKAPSAHSSSCGEQRHCLAACRATEGRHRPRLERHCGPSPGGLHVQAAIQLMGDATSLAATAEHCSRRQASGLKPACAACAT